MNMKIQKGDTVIVIKGSDKKKTGVVLRVMRQDGKAIVEGVNIRTMHKKPRERGEKGTIEKKEGVIAISNLALVDSKTKKPTRIAYTGSGKDKTRVARKSGSAISSPAGRKKSSKPLLGKKDKKTKPDTKKEPTAKDKA